MLLLTTLRQRRLLWGGLLLGVLLALLPLRGWAETGMHLSSTAPGHAQGEAASPPCHGAMAEHEGMAADGADSGCSLCSLCHGSALCQGEIGFSADAAARSVPSAVPQGYGPPALPLPERPPRA